MNAKDEHNKEMKGIADSYKPITSSVDVLIAKIAPWLLLLAGAIMIALIFQIGETNKQVQETSAYTRVSNCIVAKQTDPDNTQDDIERCYIQVEKSTGVSLERFDYQVNGEN